MVPHLYGKRWQDWIESETLDIITAFEGRASISYTNTIGTQEEKLKFMQIHAQVLDRCEKDKEFADILDPCYVVVCFGAANLAGAAPGGWGATLAASPVLANPVDGSDFMFSFQNREQGVAFLGYIVHAGLHGWLMTCNNT